MYIYLSIYLSIHTYIHTYIHTHTYKYVYVYTYVYIYTSFYSAHLGACIVRERGITQLRNNGAAVGARQVEDTGEGLPHVREV